MYSTFHGLEIGRRAILSQQAALSTTGQNIANANTTGYTRQEAVLQATRPLANPGLHNGTIPMQMGTGVEVTQLKRIRDQYLDLQYHNQQQQAGYWEAKSDSLGNLEAVFNETSDTGLNGAVDRFWQSLQELSKQPDSLPARSVVVSSGKQVADVLQDLSSGIELNQQSLSNQLSDSAIEVNSILKEVAALNKQILMVTATGSQPNDLKDRRDVLLDNLSNLVNIQTTQSQDGMVEVSVSGVKLVSGMTVSSFSIDPAQGGAMVDGNVVSLEGGAVKGLLETHGYSVNGVITGTIPTLRTNLDALAVALADSINAIHAGADARSLDDMEAGSTTSAQLLFFVDKDDPTQPPKSAANMIINPVLVDSPAKVAAATSNQIADGTNAVAMGNVFLNKQDINGVSSTISSFYQNMIGQLGMDVQGSERLRDNANIVLQQIDNQRQSVSGVSIDEEMTNMVRYQQAYNAAARYVTAVDELLDKLINGMI